MTMVATVAFLVAFTPWPLGGMEWMDGVTASIRTSDAM
jgi:hypothetical protein